MSNDDIYFEILASSLRVCAEYKPKFGTSGTAGLTAAQFQARYGADPFYRWVGLDSPLMYAAHKASGGMTSIYRQLGIGGERLFRQIIRDQLGLSAEKATWRYTLPVQGGKARVLELDARIEHDDISDSRARTRIERWTGGIANQLALDADFVSRMNADERRRLRGAPGLQERRRQAAER